MASNMRRNSNVIKMHKRIDFNIGYFVFIIIVLYITASVIMYATSKKTTIYQVNTGSLALDNVYTGLIIRDEDIITSEYSGTVNYYSSDGDKADKVSVIYSVDETGHVSELLEKFQNTAIRDEDLDSIKKNFSQYTISYSDSNFDSLYSMKKTVVSKLNHSHYNIVLNDLDKLIEQSGNTTLFHKIKAGRTGILMFTIDGYEHLQESELNSSHFDSSGYNVINLQENKIINSGDKAYRIINSDKWSIYMQLDAGEVQALSDTSKVNIRFLENDIKCSADFSLVKIGDTTYGKISLNKYMINFADKRYVEFEFSETAKSGLKIPVSSVFDKSFYTIPLHFITESGNFVRASYTKDGKLVTEPVDADIYDSDEKYYYVSMNDFSSGDIILAPDSNEQYIVGTMGELTGVYCVNRGYAVFKKVDIIDKNSEYYIVRKGTTYGLKVYDHIVLDYTTVKENELVN